MVEITLQVLLHAVGVAALFVCQVPPSGTLAIDKFGLAYGPIYWQTAGVLVNTAFALNNVIAPLFVGTSGFCKNSELPFVIQAVPSPELAYYTNL